ncbi:MAG TPA: PDZ domain-containing protein [Thermoanaerobaculia bacterium]|nr:PDZ domain-containing protein [Thermoanaerobaculia bacterium]
MKSRLFALAMAVLVTASAFADKPIRRTVVIKDGKVITDGTQVLELGEVLGGKRAYLGVSLVDISSELREHLGATKDAGVLVESVADGSPAEKAGVKVGDIIVGIDGKDVKSSGELRAALRDKKEGDSVRVEVQRGRGRQALVATLIEKEGPRFLVPGDLEDLSKRLGGGEWRARVESMGGDCEDLRARIRDLEGRLKDLEKKLQK